MSSGASSIVCFGPTAANEDPCLLRQLCAQTSPPANLSPSPHRVAAEGGPETTHSLKIVIDGAIAACKANGALVGRCDLVRDSGLKIA